MEIIGVCHEPQFLDDVDDYVQDTHPHLQSAMLELPPHRKLVEYTRTRSDGFWLNLARRFLERNVTVIPGDIKYGGFYEKFQLPPFLQDAIYQLKPTSLQFLNGMYEEAMNRATVLDTLVGTQRRDRAMARVVRATKPEIVIVGAGHAYYLKRRFPESTYTYLRPSYPTTRARSSREDILFEIIERKRMLTGADRIITI